MPFFQIDHHNIRCFLDAVGQPGKIQRFVGQDFVDCGQSARGPLGLFSHGLEIPLGVDCTQRGSERRKQRRQQSESAEDQIRLGIVRLWKNSKRIKGNVKGAQAACHPKQRLTSVVHSNL